MIRRTVFVLLVSGICSACSGGDKSPTTPTPVIAHVAGVWGFTLTVTAVTGGECFASTFQALVGERGSGTLQIQQSGSTLSATSTNDSTGSSCTYTGTAGANSLALNVTSCTASDILGARCTDGQTRNVRLLTGGVNATVSGASASGTEAETYNITDSIERGVGTLVVNYSFSATKQ